MTYSITYSNRTFTMGQNQLLAVLLSGIKVRPYKPCIITAKRSNGETVFYCYSLSQGGRMVPCAQSKAIVFGSSIPAKLVIAHLVSNWKGLSHWQVEPLTID